MLNGNSDYRPLVTEEIEMSAGEGELDEPAVRMAGLRTKYRPQYQKYMMAIAFTSVVSVISFSLALLVCSHDSTANPLDTISNVDSGYARVILESMDQNIDPCDDFYGYACGGWGNTQEIPSGYYKWNTFNIIELENTQSLKELLDDPSIDYKGQESTAYCKAKDYYRACMDTDRIELRGGDPLAELITTFGGWPLFGDDVSVGGWNETTYNLTQMLIAAHKIRIWPFFLMWVGTDDRNSSQNIIQIEQSGLGLKYPEMYEGSSMEGIAEAYGVLGAKTAAYLRGGAEWEDYSEAFQTRFQEIVDFEIKISRLFVPKDELQDPTQSYHKMQLKNFSALFPLINMTLYMQELYGEVVPLDEDIVVYTPAFFPKLVELINSTPQKLIVDYYMWLILQPFLTYVSQPFENLYKEYQEVASGTAELLPRWQRCTAFTDSAYGFATGAMFVESILPQNLKEIANEMVGEVKDAFVNNLPDNEWMDNITRQKAKEKAEAIVDRVGHPEWIENPGALDEYYKEAEVSPQHGFENYLIMRRFYLQLMLSERGKPANSSKWEMTPATVNAYYNPSHNQIVFPSGIFQRPFYNTQMPMAMNFGGIGMVMGHELTHGFDNQGRKYDKEGNLQEWWEEAAGENYVNRSQCIIDQYSQYTVTDAEIHVDGNFTLPENIADNGGLVIAYNAYRAWRNSHTPEDDQTVPGLALTPDQLYFLGFAQVWCSKETPEHARISVMSDSHSPDRYRVIGPIANTAEFAAAYQCADGARMNPAHKCKVW